MAFERTLESVSQHADEDLKNEEDTSVDDGLSTENEPETVEDTTTNEAEPGEDEADESVEDLKARLKKAEEDRDNYKQGLLSVKAEKRTVPVAKEPEHVDAHEEKILAVLYKQNERKALREVIDPKSNNYIPECVDDSNWGQILEYLPRTIDRSNPDGVVRAVRLATKMWKEDHGIADKPAKNKALEKAGELSASRSTSAAGQPPKVKSMGRKILTQSKPLSEWYK